MDGQFQQPAGDYLQRMDSPSNLREISFNGWTIAAICGRFPSMDGQAPQSAGDFLQRMDNRSNLREITCNGWKVYSICRTYHSGDGSFLQVEGYYNSILAFCKYEDWKKIDMPKTNY